MSCEYHIDAARRCVFTRCWGDLTDEDLLGHQRSITAHPGFDPMMSQCMDYREVVQVSLTTDGVRALAVRSSFDARARRAFVMNRLVLKGLARMYQVIANVSDETLRIFESREDAFEWIALEPGAEWPGGKPDWSSEG